MVQRNLGISSYNLLEPWHGNRRSSCCVALCGFTGTWQTVQSVQTQFVCCSDNKNWPLTYITLLEVISNHSLRPNCTEPRVTKRQEFSLMQQPLLWVLKAKLVADPDYISAPFFLYFKNSPRVIIWYFFAVFEVQSPCRSAALMFTGIQLMWSGQLGFGAARWSWTWSYSNISCFNDTSREMDLILGV